MTQLMTQRNWVQKYWESAIYTGKKSTLRHSVVFMWLLTLTACTSSIQHVGEKHQTAAQKWKAMAQYASSNLPQFGFTVTADIVFLDTDGTPRFELSNIKLAKQHDQSSLDLIEPEFVQKFICNDTCVQLTEYIKTEHYNDETAIDLMTEGTFLAKQLQHYEFELFDFYAELFVLNDVLLALEKSNKDELANYLAHIASQQQGASTLAGFVTNLQASLTLDQYLAFAEDPVLQYRHAYQRVVQNSSPILRAATQLKQDPSNTWQAEEIMPAWQDPSAANLDELQAIVLDIPKEAEMQAWPADIWHVDAIGEEQQAWLSLAKEAKVVSHWDQAKIQTIQTGSTVCSYQDNYFGIVQTIEGNRISLFVQGQAKHFEDGMIDDLKAGSLFNAPSGIAFIPMLDERTFERADLGLCAVN
jgi:hypothetical protein